MYYRAYFNIGLPRLTQHYVESNHIDTLIHGFRVDDSMSFCRYEEAKYIVLPHQVTRIEIIREDA